MKYVIYLDVIWVQNAILDMILLSLLTKWRKGEHKRYGRIIIGAVVGSTFSTIFYLLPNRSNYRLVYELLSCLIMIYIAIPHMGSWTKRLKAICLEGCLLHAILFFLSGIWYWCIQQGVNMRYAFWICIGSVVILGEAVCFWKKCGDRVRLAKYHVYLFYADQMMETDALVDTGNGLREPMTGRPVSIIEKKVLENILQEKIGKTEMCIIPYHSIGRRGILYGIRIPKMEIVKEEHKMVIENAIVAIYKGTLNISGGCQMILHPDILTEDN